MDPTYHGSKSVQRDGRDVSAEITIRFLPAWGGRGVGFSSDVQRYFNTMFFADRLELSDAIFHATGDALESGERRLLKQPELNARTFRAEVTRVCLSEGAAQEDMKCLLTEASRLTVEQYFADLDNRRIILNPADTMRPFEYLPSTGFNEEYITRRQCFLEYVAELRPGFLFAYNVPFSTPIEVSRRERTLTPRGVNTLSSAVCGYLCGCRPEADALVARAHELLTLADGIDEKATGDYGSGWGLGKRYAALAYVHWLRTGEPHETALARARQHLLTFYRRTKRFDRRSGNLAAPELLFLGADAVLVTMAERLAANPGRGGPTPGGLFGDALRIATAADDAERDRLKAKLRKRMPLHLFRWMHHGHYNDVAFMLHAVFPRPEGPPSRLIERAWDFLPELKRTAAASFGWDVAQK